MSAYPLFDRSRGCLATVAVLLSAAVGFAGCGSRNEPSATGRASDRPVRVALTVPTSHGLDPQASYTTPQFELLRCCLLRTLMTYRGVAGPPGTDPVPDLASGPPSVSADGLTWTFHLRRGIQYGPPLDDVEVTAPDIVRALMRNKPEEMTFGPGLLYLPLIDGFAEYLDGKADTIAGVSAPDDFTLRVRTVRPDSSIAHLFAMSFTAPIPPRPGDSQATFGTATGHPYTVNEDGVLTGKGYGPFLVSTGPYMYEGAADLDLSAPPELQKPVSGFLPAWGGDDFHGRITLVRNPSWDPTTDPNRPAPADRIEIAIAPPDAGLYRDLQAGAVDVIVGLDPPAEILSRYRSSPSLQGHVMTSNGLWSYAAEINVAQPPFDDPHVRRALTLALDRPSLAESVKEWQGLVAGSPATHEVPDAMERSLLDEWDPSDSLSGPDLPAAREEMNASRYGRGDRCSGIACRGVIVVVPSPRAGAIFRSALTAVGITPRILGKDEINCVDPTAHVAVCVGGFGADYPNAGNFFTQWWSSSIGVQNTSLLGASPDELRAWGYPGRPVPSIDGDYERCAAQLGVRATLCWARLDQFVVGELAAVVPLLASEVVRLTGPRVVASSLDQAFAEPSLDRVAVKP
jgi:peptide/nickel transport system substrate-binding protein